MKLTCTFLLGSESRGQRSIVRIHDEEYIKKCVEAEEIREKCKALFPHCYTVCDAVKEAYVGLEVTYDEYLLAIDEQYGAY